MGYLCTSAEMCIPEFDFLEFSPW